MTVVEHVSDTARWTAYYRALESERRDALFRDPFAALLAGERGREIYLAQDSAQRHEWAWITRTVLFDRIIKDSVADGVDMVVNLAAGLDARPYFMTLPATLQWVEVDMAGILGEKERLLDGHKPVCALERVRLDLADGEARRSLFASLAGRGRKALVLSEGLLPYLSEDDVGALARELAAQPAFVRWALDLMSPRLLAMVKKAVDPMFGAQATRLNFAPSDGPHFFTRFGWKVRVYSTLHEAAKLKRLPWLFRLFALFPDDPARRMKQPWSGVCLLER